MRISANKLNLPCAEKIKITRTSLRVDLSDGRTISVPLAWFPRLQQATVGERNNWRLIGKGQGIHWSDIDEDVSIEGLLAGRPSGERQASFKKWLEGRFARLGRRPAPKREIIWCKGETSCLQFPCSIDDNICPAVHEVISHEDFSLMKESQ
jgi:hypothetical protein